MQFPYLRERTAHSVNPEQTDLGHAIAGGDRMKKETEDLRLDPEKRLCPEFDEMSIRKTSLPHPTKMGIRVVDNCAEEHIM